MKKLYEVNHSYYCNDRNYFSADQDFQYASFDEFLSDWHGFKTGNPYVINLNMIFRWDWKAADPEDVEEGEELPSDELCLYIMKQRKGIFTAVRIKVNKDEEPRIREWLTPFFEYVKALWEPFGEE